MSTGQFVVLLGICLGLALGQNDPHSLQPASAQPLAQLPTVLTQAAQDSKAFSLSMGESCFIILSVAFVGVSFLMFVIQYISNSKGQQQEDLDKSSDESILNPVTLANVKQSLSFTPVVLLLIIFLVFRAETQGIIDTIPHYKTLEMGFIVVTIGLILQSLDGFLFLFKSPKVGMALEASGTILTYAGFGMLLWGLVKVQSEVIPASVAAKCFFALSLLLIALLFAAKLLQLKSRFVSDDMFSNTGFVSTLVNEQIIDEIRACASFVPILMIAFFYLHFRYLRVGNLPYAAELGMQGSTLGIFVQALSVPVRSCSQFTGRIVRAIAVVVTYAFFVVTVLASLQAGWPAPSLAIQVVLILLVLMGFLKFVMVVSQEIATFSLNAEEPTEGSSTSLVKMTKLFQDMMSTTDYATIICILCLYVHFRASFLLKAEPSEYISSYRSLTELLYTGLAGVLLQMILQLIECGVGASLVFGIGQTVCLILMNICIGGLVIVSALP